MEYKTNTNELTSVANAIRTKGGTSAQLEYPNGFISAIQNIPSGGSVNLQTKSKTYTPTTSQQTESIQPDSGYNGLSQVNVTVNPIPSQYIVPSGSDTKTANGTYDVTSLAEVVVDVTPNLQTRSMTVDSDVATHTYTVTPQSGYDGLESVGFTVNGMPSGTVGDPTIRRSEVTDHSITLTPRISTATGYIIGGSKTGTPVTISASDLVSGSETKTENGTYDVTNLAELIVDVAGATNFVTGTINTGSTSGVKYTITPYTGDGYPIMAVIVVDGGAYVSGTDWYNSLQRYAIGQWTMTKSNMSAPPTYGTSGVANQGVTTWIYKNSTSSSTTYSRSSAMNTNSFSSSDPQGAGATCVRFKDSTHLYYYVNTSSYGLHPNTTYRYFIVYSE